MLDSILSPDGNMLRIGAKSYAINKINSVEVREHRPHRHPGIVFVLVLAVIVCALMGQAGFLLGIAIAVGAFLVWHAGLTIEYHLLLTTSSKEIAALKSRDLALVDGLRSQIESAMARQTSA